MITYTTDPIIAKELGLLKQIMNGQTIDEERAMLEHFNIAQ